jgi:hypothetical protein
MTKATISYLHTPFAGIANANIDHRQGKAGKQAKEDFPLENPLTDLLKHLVS